MTTTDGSERVYRAQFLNAVAHELNTPLTPIRLHLFLLQEKLPQLDEEGQDALRAIDRNVERLHRLIQDVIHVSAMDSGRFPIRMEDVDLAQLVIEATRSYLQPAKQLGVDLWFNGPDQLHLEGDYERLHQVLDHLLRNALHHTPAGGQVQVRLARRGHWAEVEVQDTGSGFSQEMRRQLFHPFVLSQPERDDTHGHAGLGLYIARGIVELHSGTMWARSPGPGKGATFGFQIPIVGDAARHPDFIEEQSDSFTERVQNLV